MPRNVLSQLTGERRAAKERNCSQMIPLTLVSSANKNETSVPSARSGLSQNGNGLKSEGAVRKLRKRTPNEFLHLRVEVSNRKLGTKKFKVSNRNLHNSIRELTRPPNPGPRLRKGGQKLLWSQLQFYLFSTKIYSATPHVIERGKRIVAPHRMTSEIRCFPARGCDDLIPAHLCTSGKQINIQLCSLGLL